MKDNSHRDWPCKRGSSRFECHSDTCESTQRRSWVKKLLVSNSRANFGKRALTVMQEDEEFNKNTRNFEKHADSHMIGRRCWEHVRRWRRDVSMPLQGVRFRMERPLYFDADGAECHLEGKGEMSLRGKFDDKFETSEHIKE